MGLCVWIGRERRERCRGYVLRDKSQCLFVYGSDCQTAHLCELIHFSVCPRVIQAMGDHDNYLHFWQELSNILCNDKAGHVVEANVTELEQGGEVLIEGELRWKQEEQDVHTYIYPETPYTILCNQPDEYPSGLRGCDQIIS